LSGPTAVKLALDIFLFERNPRRTAIHDTANGRPVALAEAGKPKKMAESIERHGGSALARLGNARSRPGQLKG
jgi:hypothetical protein